MIFNTQKELEAFFAGASAGLLLSAIFYTLLDYLAGL
jgi:hypothetical protein